MMLKAIYESIFFREQLPQVDESDIDKLVKLIKKNAKVKLGKFNVDELKPSQKDIDWEKVSSIVDGLIADGIESMPPVFISGDMFILDGHHRVMAIKNVFPDTEIEAYQIGKDVLEAVEIFKQCAEQHTKL